MPTDKLESIKLTLPEFAEAIKGMMTPTTMTAYAQGRSEALLQEYLMMGLSEEEAQKAYSVNITPDMMHSILYRYSDFKLTDMTFTSLRYHIPLSGKKLELPKPKLRKNRMRV